MKSNEWWEKRRFGVLVHTSLSTVPAWAPIGQYPEFYQAHLDGTVRDVMLHPSPLVETLDHHRHHWGHIDRFVEFAPLNHFDQFDASEWAEAIVAAGAGYVVLTARHHDGWCWWDAPATSSTTLEAGPRRDVFGELTEACRERGLVTGASYSLLDWNCEDYPSTDYVERVIHPQVLDLVSQHDIDLLYGSGHWGAGGEHWRSDDLLSKVRSIKPSIVINDRWWSEHEMVRTFEYSLPSDIVDTPWEARRGLGGGFGINRAEGANQHLDAAGLADLYTEVIAKGGHLLIGLGADASGRPDAATATTLRQFGGWLAAHDSFDRARPWTTWGDSGHRYLQLDDNNTTDDTGSDVVHRRASPTTIVAIDVAGDGSFAALGRSAAPVATVTAPDGSAVDWSQSNEQLSVRRPPGTRRGSGDMPAVWYVGIEPQASIPIQLFPDRTAPPLQLSDEVAGAVAGDVIQLGEGSYIGPAVIPDGVTVRGLGPGRTRLDGGDTEAVVLMERSRLEHVAIRGGGRRIAWLPKPALRLHGDGATLLGCRVDGHVVIDASAARVLSCHGSGVVASGGDSIEIRRSQFTGMGWDCAIEITGGDGHEVEGCEIKSSLVGVRLVEVTDTKVRGNDISTRWWGTLLVDCENTRVLGNGFHGITRAVDIDGGTLIEVSGNAVNDGDSGCLVQRGATEITVTGNRWEANRVGLFVWDAGNVIHHDNTAAGVSEQAEVWGP